jgi:hypothetical protein
VRIGGEVRRAQDRRHRFGAGPLAQRALRGVPLQKVAIVIDYLMLHGECNSTVRSVHGWLRPFCEFMQSPRNGSATFGRAVVEQERPVLAVGAPRRTLQARDQALAHKTQRCRRLMV